MTTIRELVGSRPVFSVEADATVREVIAYLCKNQIGAVAVCQRGELAGVFSERDLMHRVVNKGLDAARVIVRDVMTSEVYFVSIDDTHHTAKMLMLNKNFRHLVVLDEKKRLKGFVSMRELLEVDLAESRDLIRKLNDSYYQHDFHKSGK
jgi:CBS domain-containing protein